nr:hypothetical protein HAGR004_31020 [Bdellovibrio sp. HAGR004]
MNKLLAMFLLVPSLANAQSATEGQLNEVKPLAAAAFPDGSTVKTIRLGAVAGGSSNAVIFQMKQADGTSCYVELPL